MVCSIEGCGKPLRAKGMCGTHYERTRCGRTLNPKPRSTGCSVEDCDREHQAKGMCKYHHLQEWQRQNPERNIINRRRWNSRHPYRFAARRLGVSESVIEYLRATHLVCEVCGSPSIRQNQQLHIDHDHATGAIRGVLCGGCNQALGFAKDNPATLRSLAEYLEARVNSDLREVI